MISHDNYTWVTDAIGQNFKFHESERAGKGRMVSMLPLSHVAAQVVDLILNVRYGFNLFFTDSSALQGNLVYFLKIAKPYQFYYLGRFLFVCQEYGKKWNRRSR
jgi:long-subunit acyl-CoA synthetase (AMP-forming)